MKPGKRPLTDIVPGLREAIVRQELIRNAAFLGVRENIAGFEVLPMTPRHYTILQIAGSPLLSGATPTFEQLRQFLLVVSPDHVRDRTLARWRFFRRCRAFSPGSARTGKTSSESSLLRMAQVLLACRGYLAEAFQDRPPVRGGNDNAPYYSDAAAIVDRLASHYHWPEAAIIDMPFKRIFQYLNCIRQTTQTKPVLFNPSDAVVGAWVTNLNRKTKPEVKS